MRGSPSRPVLLVAINARFSHCNLAVRYLAANLKRKDIAFEILEFTLHDSPQAIANAILKHTPRLIGLSVYIWNRSHLDQLVPLLRQQHPDLPIVLGGPEITYDTESPLAQLADCIIRGEAEAEFPEVVDSLIQRKAIPHVIAPSPPELADVALPYELYTEQDIANRVIYVETSRGCPCQCSYCISSRDKKIRPFPLERLLPQIESLLKKGARRFKLIDRSFNLSPDHACRILDFFLSRWQPDMQLHLELTPHAYPVELRERLRQFPSGGLHLEVGIQTLNPDVAARVHRPIPTETLWQSLEFLLRETGAIIHADLIAGLPGESMESFIAGFDRLVAAGPHELQLGILKRLHGTPLAESCKSQGLSFSPDPPYEVLETPALSVEELAILRRVAAHWERIVNRGHLPHTSPLIWQDAASPFRAFEVLSRSLPDPTEGQFPDLVTLMKHIFDFLTQQRDIPPERVRRLMREDYLTDGRRIHLPGFLRDEADHRP